MKVAAIVITFNDDYKIKEWVENYQTYKNEIFLYIIVDNGSKPDYFKKIHELFPESHIIKRTTNGGCTGAYNDGIRYALSVPDIDAIMLIGNDVRLEIGGTKKLYGFLYSNPHYGMVAPVILLKDSEIIEDFGCEVSKKLFMIPYDVGMNVYEAQTTERIVASVTGGMNIATRSFYECVGLQDENLFMYSDEVDMSIRAKKNGFLMAVRSEAKSWHQHINQQLGKHRSVFTFYLIGRNKMYLARKHFGFFRIIYVLGFLLLKSSISLALGFFSRTTWKQQAFFFWGILNGLFNNMKLPSFVIENK